MICSFSIAGQCLFVHRTAASPSRRTAGDSHTGHVLGIVKGTSEPVRFSGTTRITSGMISAALCMITWSPIRMSFSLIKS